MTARVRVRFLGTGGAANEARTQACLLVEWGDAADGRRVLLDTGSGMDVVRQLTAAGSPPTLVQDIFVSHQHVDHVGGLEPLLLWSAIRAFRDRGGPPEAETHVYAEPRILGVVQRVFEAVATAAPRLYDGRLRWTPLEDRGWVPLSGGARLRAFLVDHEPVGGGAMGCVVEAGGVRIAYTGDTRPTPRLVAAADGADLLVHEAGGLDAQAAEVHRLGHSTAGDAARAARAAGVGRLVLTHVPSEAVADAMLAEARGLFAGPVQLARDLDVFEM
jgi:ribonuclease BN (tRNA processing enzyme)